ncbi:MAG: hypothetical protein WCJ19_02050 [bacterium]
MLNIIILLFVASIVKFLEEEKILWLTLGISVLVLLLRLFEINFDMKLLPVILIFTVIKGAIIYFWLKLLYSFQDTIFTFIFILIIGSFAINIF